MTAITYCEAMAGFGGFSEIDYNSGWWAGRTSGIGCSFAIDVTIDDVDRFIADPQHEARCTGWVRCDHLGGELPIERGTFNLLVDVEGPRHRHMSYRLFLRDRDGRRLTLSAFKDVQDDWFNDVWADTSTLFTKLYAGWVSADDEHDDALIATGILRISRVGFARLMGSLRAHGGCAPRRALAKLRYARLFVGRLVNVYAGRASQTGQPDFPAARAGSEPAQGYALGEWHPCPGRPALRRRILEVVTRDKRVLTLHHLGARDGSPPHRGPVLLAHGTGTRAELFYGAPLPVTLADVLVQAGYDVFVENWRGSIDLPPCQYTLDEVARFDHPAFVARVRAETGAETVKAVVHCQGSTSFSLALAAGLLPEVTDVVSAAVSIHVAVPRRSRLRMRVLVPLMRPGFPGLDPQ